jgi:glycosyltransferase involved in cell wall biosynthesis
MNQNETNPTNNNNSLLERIPLAPPIITAIENNQIRPLWSVIIPVYNCLKYLPYTLRSVLMQDLGPDKMEIIVVDDCSNDGDVEEVVKKIGIGRIKYFKQSSNVGLIRNFEACIKLSKGYYIHILHGDDEIIEGFYNEIGGLFQDYPEIGAAFTNFEYMDASGNSIWSNEIITDQKGVLENWLINIAESQKLQYCCNVVKRSTYEALGSFYGIECVEDWLMWVRIAAAFPVAYSPKTLARYRVFTDNVTGVNLRSGKFFNNSLKCIEMFRPFLPKDAQNHTIKIARKNVAENYARLSHRIYHELNDTRSAIKQSIHCLIITTNKTTIKYAAMLFFKVMIGYKRIKHKK